MQLPAVLVLHVDDILDHRGRPHFPVRSTAEASAAAPLGQSSRFAPDTFEYSLECRGVLPKLTLHAF